MERLDAGRPAAYILVGAVIVAVAWPRAEGEGAAHVEVATFSPPPFVQVAAITTIAPEGPPALFWS